MFFLIEIGNDGQRIETTNYFETVHCKNGLSYLTTNAGASRLIMSRSCSEILPELIDVELVSIIVRANSPTSGSHRETLEIIFNDQTTAPRALYLDSAQFDELPTEDKFPFLVYGQSSAGDLELLMELTGVKNSLRPTIDD